MSYDFHLFAAAGGVDPRAIAEADDEGFEVGPRDPAKEAAKRKVADALIAFGPNMELATFDYEEIARLHRVRVDVAYDRVRYLELTDVSAGGHYGYAPNPASERSTHLIPAWQMLYRGSWRADRAVFWLGFGPAVLNFFRRLG